MVTLTPNMIKSVKDQVNKGKSAVLLESEEPIVLEIPRQVKASFPDEPVAQKIVVKPELIDGQQVYDLQSICVALTYCYELLVSKNLQSGF